MIPLFLKISKFRVAAKLTQQQLADLCGVHVTYISQLENRLKDPRQYVADKVIKVLCEQLEDYCI